MNAFDTELFYPEKDGKSYTEYFFGKDFKLSNYTVLLLELLQAKSSRIKPNSEFSILMEDFTQIANYILVNYGKFGKNLKSLGKKELIEAIEQSSYLLEHI
jgi:hypothetical protein